MSVCLYNLGYLNLSKENVKPNRTMKRILHILSIYNFQIEMKKLTSVESKPKLSHTEIIERIQCQHKYLYDW